MKVKDVVVSLYGKMDLPVGKFETNVCSNCNEEFVNQKTSFEIKKAALRLLYLKYNKTPGEIPGTIFGWIRINSLTARDDLSICSDKLKEIEYKDLVVPELIGKQMLSKIGPFVR